MRRVVRTIYVRKEWYYFMIESEQKSREVISPQETTVQPVTSLAEKRRQHNQTVLQQSKSLEQRVTELEADLLRSVDLLLDQERRLEKTEAHLLKLLRLLQNTAT
jgi:hypothetical protein